MKKIPTSLRWLLKPHPYPNNYVGLFSAEEVKTLRRDWANHVLVSEIATKLGRSLGTVRQKAHNLGLRRSGKVTRYFTWAPEHLKAQHAALGDDTFIAACDQWRRDQALNVSAERVNRYEENKKVALAINERTDLNRIQKMRKMYALDGVTLQFISEQYGLTRERVRQILSMPDQPEGPARRAARDRQILVSFENGESLESIGMRWSITSQHVRAICKAAGVTRERKHKAKVKIETAGRQRRKMRNKQIREDFHHGMSFEDLSRKYDLVPSYVKLICQPPE